MKALVILCVLAGAAHAESILVEPASVSLARNTPTHEQLFGWRFGGGMLPVDGRELQTMSLGLTIEHRLAGRWRIAGEYEYVWLGIRDPEPDRNAETGSGHRTSVALRRTVLESRRLLDRKLRFSADVELGAGMLLGSELMSGTIVLPHAFVGIRLGYTFIKLRHNTRASAVWEPELVMRVIATTSDQPAHGLGYFFGIGLNWGD